MGLFAGEVAQAGDRRFAFSYEVITAPPGEVEYEQYITWKASKEEDRDFNRVDFRHEIEVGITDHFQLGFYVADWRFENGKSVENDGVSYIDSAIEGIYNLTDPVKDPIGLALYGEFAAGDELLKLEGKLLVQKNIGRFVLVYNPTVEAEWEGKDYDDTVGVFEQTAGVSYEIKPQLMVGAEVMHELEFERWEETGDNIVHAGPNVSVRGKNWYFTLAPLFQVTSVAGEPDFITRLIVGIHF